MNKLEEGDLPTARFVGIPMEMFTSRAPGPITSNLKSMLQPLVEKAALCQAINEAWVLISILTVAAMICVPFARRSGR